MGPAELDHGEGREEHGGGAERAQHPRVGPPGAPRGGQAVDQAGQGEGDGGGAQQVEPPGPLPGVPRYEYGHGRRDERRSERDRVEDPGPAPRLGEHTAQQDAARSARTGDRPPHAQRPAAPRAGGEPVHRQGQRGRRDGCGTEALEGPGRDQYPGGGGQPRHQRGQCEQAEPGDQHPAAAEEVGQPPARQEQRPERQAVGVDDPGGSAVREAGPGTDLGERDVDDRGGEHDCELGRGERREDRSRAGAPSRCRARLCACCVHGAQTRTGRCPLSRPGGDGRCPLLSAPVHPAPPKAYGSRPYRGRSSRCHKASHSMSSPWRRWRR
ncbi:hypothetical protein EES37_19200 [Streptomyces sp. ADI91-18]|nr:hypothetical protein EES37_19200 [Streptomyces sp. ADI91-18]